MESETLDLSRICRTCKSKSSQMQSLFDEYEVSNESLHIDSMLMACSSIQVLLCPHEEYYQMGAHVSLSQVTRDDGLPSQICQVCVDQLKNAFAFKSQCERVDVSLREYVKNVKVNDIKEEEEHSDLEEE
ncbi:hypothetical protein NQ318_019563 [Aromia moschata]|uniref:ZAD domain-containing protein n=1 Tax=Aromia moschata TaxID=1265417 RepID=A0AAV8Z6L2_9CUCU|nr:hypothetical protein NQ318_019563 [Aromia moschata]